jgi:hypothetical protein
MSRRTRSQRQRPARERSATPRAQRAVTTPPRTRERALADRMATYRSLASPGTRSRLILIVGLVLVSISEAAGVSKSTPLALQVLGAIGGFCILAFVAGGMMRHYRAIYRIRRDDPGAWQPTMGFALASLAVPLGFSGAAASPREKLLRRVTLLLVLVYAATTIVALNRPH